MTKTTLEPVLIFLVLHVLINVYFYASGKTGAAFNFFLYKKTHDGNAKFKRAFA